MNRKTTLQNAAYCVLQDRAKEYGEAENNFETIAKLWSAYLGTQITATQVAMCMALLKIARQKSNANHEDNYVDLAGYAACAAELAETAQYFAEVANAEKEDTKEA